MVLTLWTRRSHSLPTDDRKLYEGISGFFTIRVNHGGVFTQFPEKTYVNGTVDHFDFVDVDLFSVHEFEDMLEQLGYVNRENMNYQFLIPEIELQYGLLPLVNDQDVITLCKYVSQAKSTHDSDDDFLAVVDTDMFESTGIVDEAREKMIYDLLKAKPCSSGELHPKVFKLGQKFKSKKDIKAMVDMHSIDTKRDLYYAKND
ncbi:hypothetical protein LXL04_008055 [Taraxacum kok-saghyz]